MSEATVIALGFFDGVHLGHGALLRKTAERARELGVTPAAFTFDRSPKEFVTGVPVPLLTSAAERAEIIREYYGIGTVFVEPFDRAMMTMPWEDFITELLVKKYRAVHLVAGHDFRFGYKNEGDPEKLREKCRALGLGCDIIPKVELDGVTVSSTYIRSLVEAGEVERAARFLGHPHRMSGTVRHGEGIHWTIFRENTEGGYAVGNSGFNVTDDLAMDFVVTTKQGSERIARIAYDYARRNGFTRVSLVTKANIVKTTDGNFLEDCHRVAALYPEITTDEWYADIMTAKLVDEKRRRDFQVLLLPNLYGDIISDEAAEFQGGVGTAGCANIGKKYAMFEAIHGSAPRMVAEGRGKYADPCSMLRACVMLLSHIGKQEKADRLERALDICCFEERRLTITGRDTGATCEAFGNYVMETLARL